MRYKGSKARIAKQLAPIIQCFIDHTEQRCYWEPFCGGCNMLEHIQADTRFASDNHKYLIALLQNLDKLPTLPERVSKEHYSDVRTAFNQGGGQYEDWYIGAIGFLSSFNGRFFDGGYAGDLVVKSGELRGYYREAWNNLHRQVPWLQDVTFACGSYADFEPPVGWVIYCDPPYKGTSQYTAQQGRFNHDDFWEWVRQRSQDNIVLVSECNAPDDFRVIWEKPTTRIIDHNQRFQVNERLYIYQYPWMG